MQDSVANDDYTLYFLGVALANPSALARHDEPAGHFRAFHRF
jgi:hypothetical protein